ncbi:MAG: sigma-54 dependent transcriptional regulator [Planctomycetota bacterium]
MRRALIADDDNLSRDFLVEALRAAGWEVEEATTGRGAIAAFDASAFDLVVTDLRMPDGDGLSVLGHVREAAPDVPVVLVTAYGSLETAIEAIRLGAQDLLVKPVSVEQIDICLRRFDERAMLIRENRVLRAQLDRGQRDEPEAVGSSPAWLSCLALADRVAATRATVLVRGESGSGKEVIASLLHSRSDRHEGPFIKTNCAVLQEGLLASELFGHEKGAFTNAYERKEGRFEIADGGTLFLDEIGEISPEVQAKLLRVLETGEFQRVGGKETIKVDVRVVCATNRDLERMMREGRFRDDLFYRLNVVPIDVPALRHRGADIEDLARHFMERFAREFQSPARRFTSRALRSLRTHRWPGNVRELANLVQRAVLLATGPEIDAPALGLEPTTSSRTSEGIVGQSIAEVERKLILETLTLTQGNKTEAARILGVTARTLSNKMRLYRDQGLLPEAPAAAR